jgi:glycosyltransferase involved in cell wall biosynthesis
MIVGIDASRAALRQQTGTEAYAYHLIRALIDETGHSSEPSYRLRLYFNQPPPPGSFPEAPHVEMVTIPFPRLWTHLRLAWELQQRPPDLFFTPAHVIPWHYRRAAVATVHDLGYHYFPEAHTRRQVAYLRWSTRHNARRARRVIADSQATKADLVRFYSIAPEKIEVVYPALPAALVPVTDPATLTAVCQKYGIRPPYLLYLGTLQPRKNLIRLLEAFAGLPGRHHQLVLAGRAGWRSQGILEEVGRQQRAGNEIVYAGFIAPEDKAALISGAAALLFPSLYEGFGFPVLEGQACGTAVLCSHSSSLPEVAGDGALLVDAQDCHDIRRGMQQLIADDNLRRQLVARGFANLQRFSWHKTAAQTLAVLKQAALAGEEKHEGLEWDE